MSSLERNESGVQTKLSFFSHNRPQWGCEGLEPGALKEAHRVLRRRGKEQSFPCYSTTPERVGIYQI